MIRSGWENTKTPPCTYISTQKVCGFKLTPTDKLCARWTTLGAFTPFFRNHAHDEAPPQEFYLWPLVADAARYAISLRYRLLDYFYTALHDQSLDGTPAINPLWYLYPTDPNTHPLDLQYFYGSCLLVSPVTADDATDVRVYLPDDLFYDLETGDPVRGKGAFVHLRDVPFDRIPLHVRGGCVLPLRVVGGAANTTAELRSRGFELVVAPGLRDGGRAGGGLFVDDGVSLDGGGGALGLEFRYADGRLRVLERGVGGGGLAGGGGRDGRSLRDRMEDAGVRIERVTVLGGGADGQTVTVEVEDITSLTGHMEEVEEL